VCAMLAAWCVGGYGVLESEPCGGVGGGECGSYRTQNTRKTGGSVPLVVVMGSLNERGKIGQLIVGK